MKLQDIKTEEQLLELGDIYYQRGHKLMAILKNENESKERKDKSFKLWWKCYVITQHILKTATEYRAKLHSGNDFKFESGGFTVSK